MEKNNIGSFSVRFDEQLVKYVIIYIEKGENIVLQNMLFDTYDDALDFINNHKNELDCAVTEFKKSSEEIIDLEEQDDIEKLEEQDNITEAVSKKEKKAAKKREKEEKKAAKKKEKEEKKAAKKKEKEEKKAAKKKEKEEKAEARRKKKEEKKSDKKNKKGILIRIVSGFLAGVLFFTGGYFASKNAKNNKNSSSNSSIVTTEPTYTTPSLTSPSVTPTIPVQTTPSTVIVVDQLTDEKFYDLTVQVAKIYKDKGIYVTTEDIIKYVAIVNIDKLAEDNPELVNQLFDGMTREEIINDASKVIGMTYTYNRDKWKETGSTSEFIKLSSAVFGNQQYAAQKVEAYLNIIAMNSSDADMANATIRLLIEEFGDPSSMLAYLDDGVGFAIQSNLELISDCIAKNVISKKNLDALTEQSDSEDYLSNIFNVIKGCNNSYARTKNK